MTSHVAPVQIRDATAADATAIAAIYAPYVMGTAITFEAEPPSADTIAARIADAQRLHAHLVGEVDGRVVGYAYGHVYNSRDAYRWACEVSIYLDSDQRRVGHGRALYAALLARLTERGYRRVLAGVTQPNPASMALHRSFGFTDAGYHRRVGWKFGAWHDVAWHQLDLLPADQEIDPPPEITYSAGDPDVARPELEDAYAAAWEEWDASGEATAWEATSADGLGDAAG